MKSPPSHVQPRALWSLAGVAALSLAGCAGGPPPSGAKADATAPAAPAPSTPTPSPSAAAPATQPPVQIGTPLGAAPSRPVGSDGGPGLSSVAGQSRTLSTQLATYTLVGFDSVPGWVRDDFSATWPAFLGSCKVLTGKSGEWKQVCDRARQVDDKNNAAIRSFFETEFTPYQIRDDDRRPDGVVTGYFEPELQGSRTYSPPYIYPVYGQPEDMLFLDVRKLPPSSGIVPVRVQGREVIVQAGLSTRDLGAPGLYALDMSAVTRDSLDRKLRLRMDGRRLVPYYTREEIETRGAPNAKVLAFVSNASALYEMQIQGSGRVRLPNGDIIRLGYAEQNGQPFRPTLAQSAQGKPKTAVRTRGGAIELDPDDDDADTDTDLSAVRVRGFTLALPTTSGAVVVPGRQVSGAVMGSGIKDPSYVFFKELTAVSGGPIGAFGVPLSAGRSIAVDPRATPLGYPVFVSTRTPGTGAPMQRLTIAQDTGGAIRGAVRADYFFGNGQQAATDARRMKERGQLWILLPRGLGVASSTSTGVRTRGGAAGADLPQCLVPEEGICVDD